MISTITYLPEDTELIDAPLWWHKKGLRETTSGYGKKLTTSYKVRYNGRLYRVYCHCFSNSGSLYIISKGKRVYYNG